MIKASRDKLNGEVHKLINQNKKDSSGEWQFTPSLALDIVDLIYEDHKRTSGRLTRHHMYAVGGYNEDRSPTNALLSDQERILGVLHDLFEDTRLIPDDAMTWGIDQDTVTKLKMITRMTYKETGLRTANKEPYCDYIEILANDPMCRRGKSRDAHDNNTVDPIPLNDKTRMKCIKKAVTISYLNAVENNIVRIGTPFNQFAKEHPETLPTQKFSIDSINKWIKNNSSSSRPKNSIYLQAK